MVRTVATTWILFVSAVSLHAPIALAKSRHPRPIRAQVRFLATSTSIRGMYDSRNQDVYLAEIGAGSERVLVRLVDDYPESEDPIPAAILRSPQGTGLRLLRDSSCDTTFEDMPLRTAPGNQMAAPPVMLSYEPDFPEPIQPQQTLPCYRIAR